MGKLKTSSKRYLESLPHATKCTARKVDRELSTCEEIRHDGTTPVISLGNIFTKNWVALVSLGINYCRNLTNNNHREQQKRDVFNSPKKLGLDSAMLSVSPLLLLNADNRYLYPCKTLDSENREPSTECFLVKVLHFYCVDLQKGFVFWPYIIKTLVIPFFNSHGYN